MSVIIPRVLSRPVAVPKVITRYSDRRRRDLAEAAQLQRVYRQVNERDGPHCRCCGRLTTTKPSLIAFREHNHLQRRSTAEKAVKHTKRNIHIVCAQCHRLITAWKIRIIGRNCDKPLAFRWTELATAREREGLRLRDEREKGRAA